MAFVREQQEILREERRVNREEAQHNREEAQHNDETLRQAKGKNVYVMENLILYRVKENNHDGAPSKQLIIPSALRKEVMELLHD